MFDLTIQLCHQLLMHYRTCCTSSKVNLSNHGIVTPEVTRLSLQSCYRGDLDALNLREHQVLLKECTFSARLSRLKNNIGVRW